MTKQRLYTEMNAEEQVAWVTEFSELSLRLRGAIEAAAKRRSLPTADAAGVVAGIRRLFALLGAWGFAQEFCEKARRYGDYMARVSRLPIYLEKVNDALAEGLTTTDERGRRVAVVLPGVPARRRGRPSKEEMAARLLGVPDADAAGTAADSAEARKRRAIARLLGIEVVAGEPVREKNNAELAAEREARRKKEEAMNPSLFGGETAEHTDGDRPSPDPSLLGRGVDTPEQQNTSRPSIQGGDGGGSAGSLSPCAQIMSDSYEARMAQDKLHLDQLAWLMSKPLQERVKLVQSQRTAAESASERAKMLAEMGGKQEQIAEYAEQAKVATEAYLATYADVDEELAVVFYRLQNDEPFRDKFVRRFKGVDLVRVSHICRPYYEKLRSPEFELRVKSVIEQESPEYAARMKAEEEKKREVSDLLRYLKRKDKPNVAQRIKTMEVRYARLVELLGEQEACVYRPIVDAAIEDYEKNYKAKDEEKARKKDADPTPSPSPTMGGESGGETAERGRGSRRVETATGKKGAKKAAAEPQLTEKGAKKETRKSAKQEGNEERKEE